MWFWLQFRLPAGKSGEGWKSGCAEWRLDLISLLVLGRSTCCSRPSCSTYSSTAGPNLLPSGPCNRGFAFVNFKSAEKAKKFSEAKECKSKPFKPSAVLEATLLRTSWASRYRSTFRKVNLKKHHTQQVETVERDNRLSLAVSDVEIFLNISAELKKVDCSGCITYLYLSFLQRHWPSPSQRPTARMDK